MAKKELAGHQAAPYLLKNINVNIYIKIAYKLIKVNFLKITEKKITKMQKQPLKDAGMKRCLLLNFWSKSLNNNR